MYLSLTASKMREVQVINYAKQMEQYQGCEGCLTNISAANTLLSVQQDFPEQLYLRNSVLLSQESPS